jgi:hypothetical protein
MANVDWPRGLQPHREVLRATEYEIPSAVVGNVDLYVWDPVILTGTGNQIDIATAGTANPILGCILAIYDSNGDPAQYHVDNGGAGTAIVADHPDQLFVCQGDGDTSFLALNDAGGNINMVSGTGSSVYFRSGWELDDSGTADGTAADQIRLIRPVTRVDNTVGIANCDWIVQINNHQRNAGIVGVGV